MTEATAVRLADLVREKMADGMYDPREVSKSIIDGLGREERDDLLRDALPSYVRIEMHKIRGFSPEADGPAPKSSKWESASSELNIVQRLKTMSYKDPTTGIWASLGDFTVESCRASAEQYRERASTMEREAGKFDALAAAMKKHKSATVKDLPPDLLTKILS